MSDHAFIGLTFVGLVLWCMALMAVVLWDTRHAPRTVPAQPVAAGMTAQGVPYVHGRHTGEDGSHDAAQGKPSLLTAAVHAA